MSSPAAVERPRGGRRGGPRRRPPRQVEVLAVEPLTERMVSITLGGEALAGFDQPAPTGHIKLFLPDADGTIRTPEVTAEGLTWPQGRPTMRSYTPRRFDADAKTLEVWFVLHGEGPAGLWAAAAEPGDRVAIGGPGGRFEVDQLVGPWWIGGDESALPAIATLIEALPSTAVAEVHLEVETVADVLELPERPGVALTWHLRSEAPGRPPGDLLVEAAGVSDIGSSTFLWAGCEAASVRRLRSHALDVSKLPSAHVTTRGYWKLGVADHPDHDFGED